MHTPNAMKRIATETDAFGSCPFPGFMFDQMHMWEVEGFITLNKSKTAAIITDKGRELAAKAK